MRRCALLAAAGSLASRPVAGQPADRIRRIAAAVSSAEGDPDAIGRVAW